MSLFAKIPSLLSDEAKLAEFIAGMPFSAHVRAVENDKYILANDYQAKYWGFPVSSEIIGETMRSVIEGRDKRLSTLSAAQALLDQNTRLFEEANYMVEQESKSVSFQENCLATSGFIYRGKIFKWPLLSTNGKTIAVFTLATETTRSTDLLKLYALYKQYLPKKVAIDQFIKYLKIKPFFHANPTESELIILLTMRKTSVHKLIAQHLNMQLVTIESHIQRVKVKLKEIRCEQLVMLLRDFHYENQNPLN